jgi:hypothetical protein
MCFEPATMATIAMGAASLGSSLMASKSQADAAEKQQDAVNKATQAEGQRQKEFADRKMAIVNSEQQDYTPDKRAEQLQAEQAQREQMLATSTDRIGAIQPYNDAAPTEVKSDLANAMLSALSKGKNYSKTLAQLGAYGALGQNNSIGLTRSAQDIGVLDGFSQGSLGALQGELGAAQRAGQSDLNKAGIYGGLGQIGSVYTGKLLGGSNLFGSGGGGIGGISGSSKF